MKERRRTTAPGFYLANLLLRLETCAHRGQGPPEWKLRLVQGVTMNRWLIALVIVAAFGIGRFAAPEAPEAREALSQASAQQQPPPRPSADPYANNAQPGTTAFPLAAPA